MHIRGMLSDNIKDFLVDPLNLGTKGAIESRTSDTKMIRGNVLKYDPLTHSVEVATTPATSDRSGKIQGLIMKCSTDFVGPVSGTGGATAKFLFQPVHVKYEQGASTGIFSRGIVGESVFFDDMRAPAIPSWQSNPTGKVEVFPAKGKNTGTFTHYDWNSNVARVTIGNENIQSWGNKNKTVVGTTETHVEYQAKATISTIDKAVQSLKA